MKRKQFIAQSIIVISLNLIHFVFLQGAAFAQGHPCDPPNVIPRGICAMDSFYGSPPRQLANGWNAYVLSGDLTYMQDTDTFWGAPSLRMWSNGGTFKAGIYTQVATTPGAGYRASIAWGAPNAPDTFGRQLGIDPTGGTDPNAPTVVWGPMHWGAGRILNYTNGQGPNIDVKARALADVVTVFFLVDHPRSTGDNYLFVDAIGLYPDESAPQLPTPTPLPPTPTPIPAATNTPPPSPTPSSTPTQTITPSPTITDTPTPTPSPTDTPTPTSTATSTASPTASPTATMTPSPTPTPGMLARLLKAPPSAPAEGRNLSVTLANIAGISGLIIALGMFGILYWRRS